MSNFGFREAEMGSEKSAFFFPLGFEVLLCNYLINGSHPCSRRYTFPFL